MAPRPITMVVAQELSEVPPAVVEEQRRAQTPTKPASSPAYSRPSPANGDESVGQVSESVSRGKYSFLDRHAVAHMKALYSGWRKCC